MLTIPQLMVCAVGILAGILTLIKADDEVEARRLLEIHDRIIERVRYDYYLALWDYQTNITQHNKNIAARKRTRVGAALSQAANDLSQFMSLTYEDEFLGRAVRILVGQGGGPPSSSSDQADTERGRAANLMGEMQRVYGMARVLDTQCDSRSPGDTQCLLNEMGVRSSTATLTEWDELAIIWKGWRDQAAKPNRQNYIDFVQSTNNVARSSGYSDHSAVMLEPYEVMDMEEQVEALWNQLKPLYTQIHAYVRQKMADIYTLRGRTFPETGHIPAHILGERMGANWIKYSDLLPFQHRPLDFNDQLVEQNYTGTSVYRLAEQFYISLGLPSVEDSFWEHSMLEEPTDGRRVFCHPNAWDFMKNGENRIKDCGRPDESSFKTAHHEMGHIYYFMAYGHHPYPFRNGANPGFHEAVGDTMALSTSTTAYLHNVGLLDDLPSDHEADINFLLKQSLTKVVFLPFALILDKWRYQVFRGEITPDRYNAEWWKLRCKYQGLYPPVARSEEDFDIGSLFHVAMNTPYLRYFVSTVLQYQFHQSLCQAAGHTGPLHTCNIHQSYEAGNKLWSMMELGASKPWPDALEALTGSRHMNASAMLEYFQPLSDWLEDQLPDVTAWDEECPIGSLVSNPSARALASVYGSSTRPTGASTNDLCLSLLLVFLIYSYQ